MGLRAFHVEGNPAMSSIGDLLRLLAAEFDKLHDVDIEWKNRNTAQQDAISDVANIRLSTMAESIEKISARLSLVTDVLDGRVQRLENHQNTRVWRS